MHTLTLSTQNDAIWQQVLTFLNQLPETEVYLTKPEATLDQENPWDTMRQALTELAGLELVRHQPTAQERDLF